MAPQSWYHPNNDVVVMSSSLENNFYAMLLRHKLHTCWLDICVLFGLIVKDSMIDVASSQKESTLSSATFFSSICQFKI